jgi:hypothetical protein
VDSGLDEGFGRVKLGRGTFQAFTAAKITEEPAAGNRISTT